MDKEAPTTFSFEAIGTHWQIDVHDQRTIPPLTLPLRKEETKEGVLSLEEKIQNRIAVFDKQYSRFRDDSLVFEMFNSAGSFTLPEDARPMMGLYETLYAATDGMLTPLIGSVMVEAGYDSKYSLVPKELHKPRRWQEVMEYEYPVLKLKEPALLDFGALGKGYMIDLVGELLEQEGVSSYVIDAGGDIRHRNPSGQSFRIGLEDPEDASRVIGTVDVVNRSICCSAGNRRAWAHFHHIINPNTLSSPRDVVSTWVIADSTILADGIATSLFFVSPDRLASLFQFEYCILYPDRSVKMSNGFGAELFTA